MHYYLVFANSWIVELGGTFFNNKIFLSKRPPDVCDIDDGLIQYCVNSIANPLELPQSHIKPSSQGLVVYFCCFAMSCFI